MTCLHETAAILDESVMAACLAFLPAVLEYSAITKNQDSMLELIVNNNNETKLKRIDRGSNRKPATSSHPHLTSTQTVTPLRFMSGL